MSKKERLAKITIEPQEISASDVHELIDAINEEVGRRERVTIMPQEGGSKVIQPDKKEEVKTDA